MSAIRQQQSSFAELLPPENATTTAIGNFQPQQNITRSSLAIANPLYHQNAASPTATSNSISTGGCATEGFSSCSSSSAYSSLSPTATTIMNGNNNTNNGHQQRQEQQNGDNIAVAQSSSNRPAMFVAQQQQIVGRQWSSPRERAQTVADGEQQQQQMQQKQQQQLASPQMQNSTPKTTNVSNWSLPAIGPAAAATSNKSNAFPSAINQPRQAFVGCSPVDPMAAFVRFPAATPHSNGGGNAGPLLPQKFPTTANLHWSSSSASSSSTSSSSVSIGGGGRHAVQPQKQQPIHHQQINNNSNHHHQSASTIDELIGGMEFEPNDAEQYRRQIAALKRENEKLRRELESVRVETATGAFINGSQASLPSMPTTTMMTMDLQGPPAPFEQQQQQRCGPAAASSNALQS